MIASVFGSSLSIAHCIELGSAVDWVAADADTGGLTVTALCELVNGFVSQCAGARDHTDATWLVDVARHDADLTFARCDDSWAVWSDQAGLAVVEVKATAHFSHVAHWHTFGDADYERDLRLDCFEDGVGREGRRDVDDGYIGTVFLDGFGDGVADGHGALPQLAAFARSDPSDDVGAVLDAL